MREAQITLSREQKPGTVLSVYDKKFSILDPIFFDGGKKRFTVKADKMMNYFLSEGNEKVSKTYDSVRQITVQKGESRSSLLYAEKGKEKIWLLPPGRKDLISSDEDPNFREAGKYENIYYDKKEEKFMGEKNGKRIHLVERVLLRKEIVTPEDVKNN